MGGLSIWHWLIVGAGVLIVFGGKNKISDIMGDVAKGINSFKKGLAEEEQKPEGPHPSDPPTRTIDLGGTVTGNRSISRGDIDILRLLAAVEILESDLWEQYNELGGIQDSEEQSGSGNGPNTAALQNLDGDMPQYIHDNTDDEFSHESFINAFLVSIGAHPVNLDRFRTLPGSQAAGANKAKKRLTNLMQLTVDTSYWTRYRDPNHNPDLDPAFAFPQAVPGLAAGKFPAIPRTDSDTTNATHIQAIANTAVFHFGSIEQGWDESLPGVGAKSHPSGRLADPSQHRPDRNNAFADLARQGGQHTSPYRSDEQSCLP